MMHLYKFWNIFSFPSYEARTFFQFNGLRSKDFQRIRGVRIMVMGEGNLGKFNKILKFEHYAIFGRNFILLNVILFLFSVYYFEML